MFFITSSSSGFSGIWLFSVAKARAIFSSAETLPSYLYGATVKNVRGSRGKHTAVMPLVLEQIQECF